MRRAFYFILSLVLLLSCKEHLEEKPRLLPELYGDWIPAGYQIISDSGAWFEDQPRTPILAWRQLGYSFDSTGVVDFKPGFFIRLLEEKEIDRRKSFLTKTKYHIKQDSLKILDPTDSTWWAQKVVHLSNDTLSLAYGPGVVQNFVKKKYNILLQPNYDKIVVSSSGCFGNCEITSTIINRDGKVTFFGYNFIFTPGFIQATIPEKIARELHDNFKKANIETLSTNYSVGCEDCEELTVTFVKGDSIYKTITDDGRISPVELQWALLTSRYLYQQLAQKPIPIKNLPSYLSIHLNNFQVEDKVLPLSQSESFLLWEYLRQGKPTTKTFNNNLKVKVGHYILRSQTAKGFEGTENQVINEIQTDGRYFRFYHKSKKPITIDIGFNFINRNFTKEDFKTKNVS